MGQKRKFYSERSALKANREDRNGRVLKAFRRVAQDDVELIGGGLMELSESHDIPKLKPQRRGLQAFIFDPRLMDRNTNSALMAGFQIGRLVTALDNDLAIDRDEGYDVEIKSCSLQGHNRTTVLAELQSDRLTKEREAIYSILGSHGIKGFSTDGKRKGHRNKETITFPIGTFDNPIPKNDRKIDGRIIAEGENKIMEKIEDTLIIQLGSSAADLPVISLGELEIMAYSPGR